MHLGRLIFDMHRLEVSFHLPHKVINISSIPFDITYFWLRDVQLWWDGALVVLVGPLPCPCQWTRQIG